MADRKIQGFDLETSENRDLLYALLGTIMNGTRRITNVERLPAVVEETTTVYITSEKVVDVMAMLMLRVDDKWGCKTEDCHKFCDSHPCLIQAGLKWRYCEDCKTIFDFWKYDSLEDAGHDGHNIRILTLEEYLEATKSCKEAGCDEDAEV